MTPPHDVRLIARGGLAGAACDLVLTGAVLSVAWLVRDVTAPTAFLYALAAGLVGGVAWGTAEVVARRVTRPRLAVAAATLAGLAVALLAPVAGDYVLALHETLEPQAAAQVALDGPAAGSVGGLVLFLSGALCLHLPLLLARRQGEHLGREALAMTGGLLAWLAALAVVDAGPFAAFNLTVYLALLLPRALLFPLLLRGADRLTALVSRAARGVREDAPAPRGPRARARTPSPVERHRARLLDDRGREHLDAGRCAEAATDLGQAHELWPTCERALLLARARAGLGSLDGALAALEDAAALAGGRPAAFDPAAPAWEALRGHARLEALLALPPARPLPPRRPGLALLVVTGAATLVLAAGAPLAFTPGEVAELTRLRLRALLLGGDAWLVVGDHLKAGCAPQPGAGLPSALLAGGLVLTEDRPDRHEAAADAYVRAARAGSPEAMLRASRALSEFVARQDEAERWLRQAAEAGHPRAMRLWGRALREGWYGLRPDPAAGDAWWARAREHGVGADVEDDEEGRP